MGVVGVGRGCYLFVYNYVHHLAVDIALRFSGEAETLFVEQRFLLFFLQSKTEQGLCRIDKQGTYVALKRHH